jgi:hypothetical protein
MAFDKPVMSEQGFPGKSIQIVAEVSRDGRLTLAHPSTDRRKRKWHHRGCQRQLASRYRRRALNYLQCCCCSMLQ